MNELDDFALIGFNDLTDLVYLNNLFKSFKSFEYFSKHYARTCNCCTALTVFLTHASCLQDLVVQLIKYTTHSYIYNFIIKIKFG